MALELACIAVFLLSIGFVLYVLFGYPLLAGIFARTRRLRVAKGPAEKTVSFLLPVHNGEAFLAEKLRSILALDYPRSLMEVIVLSDGSTDNTDAIAESFASEGVRSIRLPRGGKAVALNRALAEARNELLILTDVRQMLERDSLKRLVECFADPSIGVVSGHLLIRQGERVQEADIGLYRRYEAWLRTQQSAFASVLGASGCYYAMRRDLARPMPEETLLDDMYLPLCAMFDGYRCILEPSARCYDLPTALDTEFRRKVRTLAGVYQLLPIFPQLLKPWTMNGFNFLSLKFGRLLLPFAFIAIFPSSLGLPPGLRAAALIGQALFYGAALVDLALPESFPLKRLTSPIRSFVVLITSAACATSILFVSPQNLWKQTVVQRTKPAS